MNLKFLFLFALALGISTAQAQTTSLINKKYYVTNQNGTTYTESLSRTPAQVLYQYKLTIKNADGADHLQKNCSGLSFIPRLLCAAENVIQQAYIDIFRVNSAIISINNVALTTTSTFTKNTKILVVPLTVAQTNQLKLVVKGNVLSFIDVKLESTAVNTDTTAPIQLANVLSNTITKNPLVHISVNDNSPTTTYVWNNQHVLLNTTTDKEFDINLSEGLNNFVIQTKDSYNNTSSFLYLNDITLDTISPNLNITLASEYIYSSYPQNFTINITSDEDLQNLTINNITATLVAPKTYSTTLNINNPQTLSLDLKAFDLAGNEKIQTYSVVFGIDNTPPAITSSLASNSFTNINTFQVHVTDNTSFTTEVYSNNQLILTSTEANFNLSLTEGLNNFIIKSKDQYGNEAPNLVLSNITLDTVIPSLTYTNIASPYYTNILPDSGDVEFRFNEPLRELIVDGQLVTPSINENFLYRYVKVISQAGINTVVIKATDLAGNIRNRTFNVNVIFDNAAPQIFFGPVPIITDQNSFLLSVQVFDQSVTVITRLYVNDVQLASVNIKSFSYFIQLPTDGIYKIQAISEDQAGNLKTSTTFVTKKADMVAPIISNNLQSSYTLTSLPNILHFQFTSNETLKSFKVDGQTIDSTSLVYNYEKLVSQINSNQVTIEATDLYDNVTQQTYDFNVIFDNTPPSITIGTIESYTNQLYFLLPVSIVEQNSVQTEIRVNGNFIANISEKNFSYYIELPTDGVYNISVTSTDFAGNSSTQNITTTKDTQPPVLNIGQLPATTSLSSAQLLVDISDSLDVDTDIFVNNVSLGMTSNKNFSQLISLPTNATYSIYIVTTDKAHNSTSQQFNITRIEEPLTLSIITPASGGLYDSQIVEVNFTTNKVITKAYINNIEVPLNADQKSVTYQFTNWSEGLFNLAIKVEDASGNVVEQNVEAEIRLGSASAWTYEECPVQE
ncbi:MAG: Ig-like domain-containing protein [Pseudobdellovibrio sp.]